MEIHNTSSVAQSRQVKEKFANAQQDLSYELAKAVQELPPLYTRLLASTITLLVFGSLAWAHWSQVDEVAVAPGELVPSAQVRPVRSLGSGVIQEIKVKEGDRVTKGEVLIKRDAALSQSEIKRLENSIQLIQEDIARLESERTGESNSGTTLQDQLLTARFQEFDARQGSAAAEANRQVAALSEAKVRLAGLQENLANAEINLVNAESIFLKTRGTLANAEKREQSLRTLIAPENGAIPRVDYLEAEDRLIQAQNDSTRAQDGITNARDKVMSLKKEMAAQQQVIYQAEQAYQSVQASFERLGSERRSEILTQLNKRREELTNIEGQLAQAQQQRELEVVEAPVTGTVYSVKATKGPVQAGEELLSILPADEALFLEVKVLNRDIGFIHQGMKAKVKMATFPFQEFGTLEGTVMQVSPNAIVDEDLGLVFPTKIKLNQYSLKVRGQAVKLTPGMTATGEIVIRKRSILAFIVEPVTRRFSEAFSVR